MSNEDARRLVSDGLQLRRQRREEAERESRMEEYEKAMIAGCNGNCANARKNRQEDARQTMTLALEAARQQEQQAQLAAQRKREREQMRAEWERETAVWEAARKFAFFCMGVALVTVWTPFPWWGAAALIFGTAALVGAYIFRVYFPV